ncbi:MAG: hypothetical protein IIZ52_02375 [Erysipelotrichaceae bacterium]|nr:hypothetical protein [Erysipelotrichaceae bacterium]
MKKLLTALLGVLLLLSFAGCSSGKTEPAKEEPAQNEPAKEETKEETPAPEEKEEENSQSEPLSLSAVFDYTFPEDWNEVDKFVFEAYDGEVNIYLYLLPKRPQGIDAIPADMTVADADFPEAWRQYVEAVYGMKAEYGALPGFAAKSGGGVDYFHTSMTLINDQGPATELMNVYDYNEDVFLLVEYVYGVMMAGKANECAKAFNETLGYAK